MPQLPPPAAASSRAAAPLAASSAAACLAPEEKQRPETPPRLRPFRKSAHSEPGQRVVHRGLADLAVDTETRFGARGAKSESARELLRAEPSSPLREALAERAEANYRSRRALPVGRAPRHPESLPPAARGDDFVFGMASASSEDAATVVFPPGPDGKRHLLPPPSEREVTRPRRRDYDWARAGIDPDSFCFGAPQQRVQASSSEGVRAALSQPPVAAIAPQRVAAARSANREPLGASRLRGALPPGLPADFVFGSRPAARDEWGAGHCILGGAEPEAEAASPRPRHGRRAAPLPPRVLEATFGAPSVRGSEGGAGALLTPSQFASLGLSEADFERERPEAEVRALFRAAAPALCDEQFAALAAATRARHGGRLSLEAFRRVYNELVLHV